MAKLKVEIFKLDKVEPHPNADRMELAFIGGWQSCVPIGKYKAGSKVVYLPVDSIVPADVENVLFPPGSKVKLKKSRIRSIKLRGAMSQGMVEAPETLGLDPNIKVGTDVAKKLGITKFQPPVKVPGMMQGGPKKKRHRNPDFKVYTSINHFKYYIKALEGMEVFATEKIHGTNFRAGYVKYNAYNWWRKILAPFGRLFGRMDYEYAYGSHRVELTRRGKNHTGFYKKNVYHLMSDQYDLKNKLGKGEVIYAEIYGYGIQKKYDYGCPENTWRMAVVDVMVDGNYLSGPDAIKFCSRRGLPFAPLLYIGEFNYDELNELCNPDDNQSYLQPDPKQQAAPVEGIVLKPIKEQKGYMGRMVFKWINDEYWLAKGNSDWH